MTDLQRVNITKQHPAAYKALTALSSEVQEAAAAVGLDPLLVELLKIRASQINGCAFCLRMHTRDALKKGETPTGSPYCPDGKRPATSPRPTAPPSA
ncbi:carboxymuconolactone decarboxylase family protein [Streptomyces sp. KLMMK]|uniref:carboxymuconolactone decarboxylase family protein n=1 Tax=Streptomyces sp. KLMMK TaxID=3109353 RepID=UPI002FFFF29F